MMRGDLRDSIARYSSWPSSWRTTTPLLERAVQERSRSRTATRIIGPAPKVTRVQGGYLVDDELVGAYPRDARARGEIRYGPPGRVIAVR